MFANDVSRRASRVVLAARVVLRYVPVRIPLDRRLRLDVGGGARDPSRPLVGREMRSADAAALVVDDPVAEIF